MSGGLPHVLAIETTTPMGSVAVYRGEHLLVERSFATDRSHNAQVFEPIREALDAIGGADALNLIVVGTGPGSYTGARIGIAAAQGLAMAGRVPLLGMSSLVAADVETGTYAICGDARRGSAYLAEVADRSLTGRIRLVTVEAARDEILRWRDDGRLVATFDCRPLIPGIRCTVPRASILGGIAVRNPAALTEAVAADGPLPVIEPIYLREAYITEPVRAGKRVP